MKSIEDNLECLKRTKVLFEWRKRKLCLFTTIEVGFTNDTLSTTQFLKKTHYQMIHPFDEVLMLESNDVCPCKFTILDLYYHPTKSSWGRRRKDVGGEKNLFCSFLFSLFIFCFMKNSSFFVLCCCFLEAEEKIEEMRERENDSARDQKKETVN